jgi:prepilin-type N-terminal cleavage/methylation domain-containing protein
MKRSEVKHQSAFTLLEIMIVVLILAILTAMTIPSLLKSKSLTNETAAISNLKAISTAQFIYYNDYKRYINNISLLRVNDDLLDDALVAADYTLVSYTAVMAKAGYYYASNLNYDINNFVAFATPSNYGYSGRYTYILDRSNVCYQVDEPTLSDADQVKAVYGAVGAWEAGVDSWTMAN